MKQQIPSWVERGAIEFWVKRTYGTRNAYALSVGILLLAVAIVFSYYVIVPKFEPDETKYLRDAFTAGFVIYLITVFFIFMVDLPFDDDIFEKIDRKLFYQSHKKEWEKRYLEDVIIENEIFQKNMPSLLQKATMDIQDGKDVLEKSEDLKKRSEVAKILLRQY